MSTGDPRGDTPAGVSAVLALVIGIALFVALSVLGLGMLSYFTEADLISVPGLGLWPGIVATVLAIAVFAGMLGRHLSRRHPSFPPAASVGLVAALVHLAAVWLGALISEVGLVRAASAVSQLVTRGGSLVVLLAATAAAWIAIALRRTRASAPRWPWERADEE